MGEVNDLLIGQLSIIDVYINHVPQDSLVRKNIILTSASRWQSFVPSLNK